MTDLMQREIQEIGYMLAAGMAVMLLFQTRNVLMERFRQHNRLKVFIYLFFWAASAFLFYQFLYNGSYGILSWYSLLAFAAGCILWKKMFCGILILYENAQKYNGDKKDEEENKGENKGF